MEKIKGVSRTKELVLEGIPASPGITIGPTYVYSEPRWEPVPRVISASQVPEQIQNFRNSVQAVLEDLKNTYEKIVQQYGPEIAEIIEVQIAFLEDTIFLGEVEEVINSQRYDAAYATFQVFRKKKEHFLRMSNEYFRDRAQDIQNLKERIIKHILGYDISASITIDKPVIVIADTLTPSDTVHLHKQKLLGFATNTGGKTSHTAIVARALSVPAVVGLKKITEMVESGTTVILDGSHGRVIVNPSPETIRRYKKEQQHLQVLEEKLRKESKKEAITRDGKQICLQANIEFEEELPQIKQVGAKGIGLYRTEGLFINRSDLPDEEEQTRNYTHIAETVYPHKVVIRTADIGGDKILPGIFHITEENPFLGWRAIRFWLDHKEGFLAQLKAILRANQKHNVQILLPMVSSVEEVLQVRELLEEAKHLLKKEGKPFGEPIDLGVMIEIPSAVVVADQLANVADFFSIGTNDLVQYTLAVDRGNEKVANIYSHFNPAVIRMLQMTLEAGKQANKLVGMCGEMAADPLAIPLLLAMGFECLSASPTVIPEIKQIIRRLELKECLQLYEAVKQAITTSDIVSLLKEFFQKKLPDLYEEIGA